jgi:gluconate 2-dehydrogenase gamma chain
MKSRVPDIPQRHGRRQFLSGSAALVAASAAGIASPASGDSFGGELPWQPGKATAPQVPARGFLSADERAFVEAAVARLIPADELGGGGLEAGCAEFIDRQLAGPYGSAEALYMQGPWQEGTASQGFQSRLTPAQAYRAGIAAITAHCRSIGAAAFHELTIAAQDDLLQGLEQGTLDLPGLGSKGFFDLLLQNTLEGFWSDPLYGGNRDFIGWQLIGFPGARYDYSEHIGRPGERYPLPPLGLKGRKDWSSRG